MDGIPHEAVKGVIYCQGEEYERLWIDWIKSTSGMEASKSGASDQGKQGSDTEWITTDLYIW